MDEYVKKCDIYLKSKHVRVQQEWLVACIEWLKEEESQQIHNRSQLQTLVYEQWLMSDLCEIAQPVLGHSLAKDGTFVVSANFALQVNHVLEIGSSVYSQLQKAKGEEAQEDILEDEDLKEFFKGPNSENSKQKGVVNKYNKVKSSRMLMFELTDGSKKCDAIEYSPINVNPEKIEPGAKILVKGPITCRRNTMLLKQQNFNLLGGNVESLLETNQPVKFLSKLLNIEPGVKPEPGQIKVEPKVTQRPSRPQQQINTNPSQQNKPTNSSKTVKKSSKSSTTAKTQSSSKKPNNVNVVEAIPEHFFADDDDFFIDDIKIDDVKNEKTNVNEFKMDGDLNNLDDWDPLEATNSNSNKKTVPNNSSSNKTAINSLKQNTVPNNSFNKKTAISNSSKQPEIESSNKKTAPIGPFHDKPSTHNKKQAFVVPIKNEQLNNIQSKKQNVVLNSKEDDLFVNWDEEDLFIDDCGKSPARKVLKTDSKRYMSITNQSALNSKPPVSSTKTPNSTDDCIIPDIDLNDDLFDDFNDQQVVPNATSSNNGSPSLSYIAKNMPSDVTIQCRFKTLTSRLEFKERYHLKAIITDEVDNVDVVLGERVLSELIGYSSRIVCAAISGKISPNEKTQVKRALTGAEQKLQSGRWLAQLEYNENENLYEVISMQNC